LRACRAYDPDLVVTFPRLVEELEQIKPGWFQIKGQDGKLLTGREREEMFAKAKTQAIPYKADATARDLIAGVCSPYRTKLNADTWYEDRSFLSGPGDRHFHDALAVPGAHKGPVLACPSGWGGMLGVAVASHVGLVEAPDATAGEPKLSEKALWRLTNWLLRVPGASAPAELVWSPSESTGADTNAVPLAHQRAMAKLVNVSSGMPYRQTGLVVVGDTPEDFALARLWQLMFGTGIWLPSILGVDLDKSSFGIGYALGRTSHQLKQQMGKLALTSLSRSAERVEEAAARLLSAMWTPGVDDVDDVDERGEQLTPVPSNELSWNQPMSSHLGIEE
jgi:hypothetical protein